MRKRVKRVLPTVIEPELPVLRRIKIGGRRSKSGKGFIPTKWDHFKVTFAERDGTALGNFRVDDEFHELIGEKEPKELDVRLMFDEVEQNFETKLMAYRGRDRICTGNGQVAYDEELKREIPCTCPLLATHEGEYLSPKRPIGQATCKPSGKLKVLLEAQETFGGVAVFDTTSYHTIRGILGTLEDYRQRFRGILAGLPLRMVITPDTATPKGLGKTVTIYKVALILRANYDTALQLAAATRDRREQLALPSPAQLDRIEEAVLQADVADEAGTGDEFYPAAAEEEAAEDHESERLEWICRRALELAETDPVKINDAVARYSDQMAGLLDYVRENRPQLVATAEREWEAAHLQPEDLDEEEETEGIDVEPEPADAEAPVVEGEIEEEEESTAEEGQGAEESEEAAAPAGRPDELSLFGEGA